MNIKKRMATLFIVAMMSTSATTVFAENRSSIVGVKSNNSAKSISSIFTPKTVDGQEIHIPDANEVKRLIKKNPNKAKSSSNKNYTKTKTVADEKASVLTAAYEYASVQYALIDNGNIVLSGNAGVYSKEGNKQVANDNMYSIASISKVFTATAIMKLVDEGLVNLDDPVTKYIKEFKMADKRYKKITVRMLLNHSAGLMGASSTNIVLFNDKDSYNHDTFLKRLKTQRLQASPGEYSVYSNDSFTLAEILIERVSGVSYTEYIANNITDKLKMNNTKTTMSEFDRNKISKAYIDEIESALPVENFNSLGAAGIYSTAEDLCTFATTFTKNSNGLLSQKSIKAMENKEYLRGIWVDDEENSAGYGLGWDSVNLAPFNQYNIKALVKGGDSHLYHSSLIVLPEKNMAIAIVSSGGTSVHNQIMGQEVLLAALKEKGEIKDILPNKTLNEPQQVAVPSEVEKYEGAYATMGVFTEVDIDKSGTMKLSIPGMSKESEQLLYYTKEGTFVSSDGVANLRFVKESNGKTYIQEEDYLNYPYLGLYITDQYVAQREEIKTISENISKTWQKRDGKKYYLLNEKYSSEVYMLLHPVEKIELKKGFEGYIRQNRIVDKNSAVSILNIPDQYSRDQIDYKFYNKAGHEYLNLNGAIYGHESLVKTLPTDSKFKDKIKEDGYANWYNIGDESADKEVIVDMPKNAAFVVYDSEGLLVNDSFITGSKNVILPKGGTMAFLGDPHTEFNIQYK